MSLYFDNFGGSGRPAWTNTLAPPAPSKPSGPPPGMVYSQAQPVQPPSQGTPYGQQPKAAPKPADFSAYKPQQQAPANPFTQYNPQQMGNFVQQQMGLPSFQFSATDPFGNTYNNPAALTAQQGAMAQALNAQRAQQVQSGNFGPLNPMAAYQQAQNMVQGGWTNPFAAQPIQPPSQGAPYGQPGGGMGGGPGIMASPQQDSNIAKDYARYGINTQDPKFRQFADQYAKQEVANRRGTELGGAYDTATVAKAFLSKQAADYWATNPGLQTMGPSPQTPAAPPPPRQANPNTPTFGVYPPGTVSSPDSPVPAPIRPAPQGQAQPIQPPSQGTPYGGYDLGNDMAGGPYSPGSGYQYQRTPAPAIPRRGAEPRRLDSRELGELPLAMHNLGHNWYEQSDGNLLLRDDHGDAQIRDRSGKLVRDLRPPPTRAQFMEQLRNAGAKPGEIARQVANKFGTDETWEERDPWTNQRIKYRAESGGRIQKITELPNGLRKGRWLN